MPLNKLSSSTVKLISSSQVITSVSSVVKELIENSLDAGATNIEIKLENHGLKKIEVVDNGKGVKKDDVWNMCKKSYTSKIRNFDDLCKLETYGFRGEALSSLCAVSKVSVTTKTENDNVAMTYEFDNNGNIIASKMSHINKGSIIVIENLFDNLPVRRQFLTSGKRKSEEIKKVETTVKMLAVIHPRLRVTLSHNKFFIWQKNSVANIRQSLVQAIAPTVVKQLVDLRFTLEKLKLQLLIPEKGCNISSTCYKNPVEAIYLFINHRPVRDRNIEKIVETEIFNYFGHEIPSGKHPTCLVSIVVPPDAIDVNLEPNKTRVILKDMDEIGSTLKNKLVEYYIGPLGVSEDFFQSIDSEVEGTAEKRKNDDNMIEVKVKIPKIYPEFSKNSGLKNKNDSPKKDEYLTNTNYKEPAVADEKRPDVKAPVSQNLMSPDRDKIVSDFMEGLRAMVPQDVTSLKKESATNLEINNIPSGTSAESQLIEDNNAKLTLPEGDNLCGKDKNNSSSIEFNKITLSQWSRGHFKINSEIVESSTTVLGQNHKLESNKSDAVKRNESLEIVNYDCLTKTPSKMDLEDCNRSVSSQMGCKDMAGFTRYATEMSKKITESSEGMTFTKVASELANNWRKLHDSEKEMFNERAKTKPKPSREKEDKSNASMREQLQKFLAKCNEKKVLKKRSYPRVAQAEITLPSVRKALERRVNKVADSDWRAVGDLGEDLNCLALGEDGLYAASERRLAESLLFYNNLATLIVPYRVLELNIPVTSEKLGESLWSVLASLETSVDPQTGNVVVSDPRITSNGLRIQLTKDSSGSCFFEITDVPLNVPFFGFEDLKEILTLIERTSMDLPLEECRPLKIISFIRAETLRSVAKNEFQPKGGIFIDKFKFWFSTIRPKIERCPHQEPIMTKLEIPS